MNDFTQFVDLASERLGGRVLAANDEFFAPKRNLLKAAPPVYIEGKYTARGKWMDGWETRRRRRPGNDWCLIRLGAPGILRGVLVDTSHFKGNYPSHASLEACAAPRSAAAADLLARGEWVEVLPRSPLTGDSHNLFPIENPRRFTHLRLHIYPDGGVARLRVYGEVLPDWKRLLAAGREMDLAALVHGGRVLAASDMFFSAPQNLLLPGRARNMGDGWETRRRRGPGHDWVVVELGIGGTIRRVEVDTTHFKGNFPESCALEACSAVAAGPAPPERWPWQELLRRTPLRAHRRHVFRQELRDAGAVTHVRFNIYPDGGVSRLRLYGTPSREGRMAQGMRWLDSLSESEAEAALRDCCGSARWARQMVRERPFASLRNLFEAAERIWTSLDPDDWLEAFRAHPAIGESRHAADVSAKSARWSEQEQAGVRDTPARVREELAAANRAYRDRFGYVFLICATGKTAEEILAALRRRLNNDPETELRTAACEQAEITRLRLEKLLEL